MREIKFRAWSDNKMTGPFFIGSSASMAAFDCIEQFTGLRDKNGKEIYEGDILADKAVVEWFNRLTWDGGCAHPGYYCRHWSEYKEDGDMSYHDDFEGVEVIGNIHDNPELLER